MMKKHLLIMTVAIAILMIAEYQARGYFAIGAEILIIPLWIFTLNEWKKWKRGESR